MLNLQRFQRAVTVQKPPERACWQCGQGPRLGVRRGGCSGAWRSSGCLGVAGASSLGSGERPEASQGRCLQQSATVRRS